MGRWACPGWCDWSTALRADSHAPCSWDTWGLWGQGSAGLDGSVDPGRSDVGNMGREVYGLDSPAGRRRCWSPASRGPLEAAPRRRPCSPEDAFDKHEHAKLRFF